MDKRTEDKLRSLKMQAANCVGDMGGAVVGNESTITKAVYDNAKCAVEDIGWRRRKFSENLQKIFAECYDLTVTKNSDYTKLQPDNPYHNFEQDELKLFFKAHGVPLDDITVSLLIRINEKKKRVFNLILTGTRMVLDESIEDTLKDLANLSVILLNHLRMNGERKPSEPTKEDLIAGWKGEATYYESLVRAKDKEIGELTAFKAKTLESRLERRNGKRPAK